MSKTSQENKKKKLAVEVLSETEVQKAQETPVEEIKTETEVGETTESVIIKKSVRVRGKKYVTAKKKVDVNILSSL